MNIPIVAEMLQTAQNSIEQLKNRITNIRYGKPDTSKELWQNVIYFNLDGEPKTGILRGRNKNLLLGFGVECDKSIACRVLIDGDLI
jgi:hypothetical protein